MPHKTVRVGNRLSLHPIFELGQIELKHLYLPRLTLNPIPLV